MEMNEPLQLAVVHIRKSFDAPQHAFGRHFFAKHPGGVFGIGFVPRRRRWFGSKEELQLGQIARLAPAVIDGVENPSLGQALARP